MAKAKPAVKASQAPVEAKNFDAAAYARSHDDPNVSAADIVRDLPSGASEEIAAVEARLSSLVETSDTFMQRGAYTANRQRLHERIINDILSDEKIAAATPPEGQAPTFTILGGRGGSGKSWFEGNVYDPEKSVVLDADHIKGMLPEYEGWNAAQVHTESGQIFEKIVEIARALGLNVVLDKTMKTAKSAIAEVQAFKAAGYRTEAHYMHLPRKEAAQRAAERFLGESKRYVPVEIVLANTSNESTFDQVRLIVDRWSFRDNNVTRGAPPILISEGGA
ncbi:zeta toxin family protein [Methylobacterium sp. NPDC080182]|uniref:zeta toxin family protein n=1 Tax=Methylobacterium sp. NPDC080182 TaxID=3390590 RepID=UPI003D02DD16